MGSSIQADGSCVSLQLVLCLLLPLAACTSNVTQSQSNQSDVSMTTTAATTTVLATIFKNTHKIVGTTQSSVVQPVPEVILTLAVIALCALCGVGIAKLADFLYDRRVANRDDLSDASEHTKNLLRASRGIYTLPQPDNTAGLTIMKMKGEPKEPNRSVKRAASAWMDKASQKKKPTVANNDAEKGTNKAFEPEQPSEQPATSSQVENEVSTVTDTSESQTLHPVEKLDISNIKPSGRLPPVSITAPNVSK